MDNNGVDMDHEPIIEEDELIDENGLKEGNGLVTKQGQNIEEDELSMKDELSTKDELSMKDELNEENGLRKVNKLVMENGIEGENRRNIEKILRNFEQNPSISLSKVDSSAGSKEGDNYMSVVKRVVTKGKFNDNQGLYTNFLLFLFTMTRHFLEILKVVLISKLF